MFELETDPKLIFVPSVKDIEEYDGKNVYYCGLEVVAHEVQAIPSQLQQEFFQCAPAERALIASVHMPRKKPVANAFPDFIFELVILITTGAASAALYKLIDSWIAHRNGRKLRIRLPSGFEVEASQLTEQEFERLFQYLYAKYGPDGTFVVRQDELTRLGFKVVSPDELQTEMSALRSAYFSKAKKLGRFPEARQNDGET
jgi:hypothetical protein